jgi:hypothetical protein
MNPRGPGGDPALIEEFERRARASRRERPAFVIPDIRGRFRQMIAGPGGILLRDEERGREQLRCVLEGEKVRMVPEPNAEIMVGDRLALYRHRCGCGPCRWCRRPSLALSNGQTR